MKASLKKHFANQIGFTLIETVVAGSLLVIIVFAVTTAMLYQYGQNRVIQQKIESLELEQDLNRILIDASNCDCMFVTAQSVPINLAQSAPVIGIQLNQGCTGNPWIAANSKVQGTVTGLQIQDISLKNISPAGAGSYTADLAISMGSSGGGIPLKSLSIPQTFFTSATGDIISCAGLRQITQDKIDKFCTSILGAHIDPTTGKCTTGGATIPVGSNPPPGAYCGPGSTGLVVYSGNTPQCLQLFNGVLTSYPP